MAEKDGGGVVVLLAAPLGAFRLRFGEFGRAGAPDEFLGSLAGKEVEEVGPVGEAEAFDESGGSVAEKAARRTSEAGSDPRTAW